MAANIQPISLVGMLGLFSDPIMPPQLEAAAQSWKKGAPLIYSSGLVAIASATPTTGLIGISTGAASGITNNPTIVIPFLKNLIFEITIDGVLSGGNAPGNGSLAQSNVGTTYAITQDGTSKNFYLVTSGGTPVCTLLGFQTNISNGTNDAGVVNGRALVSFLASTSIWT